MITFQKLIGRLVEIPESHARFVNTLSLLEYMGARKIFKSQKAETISTEILAHMSEEIRHSQVLKKIALKMSSGKLTSFQDDELLCGAEAREYFQTIDRFSATELGYDQPWLNYLSTTLMIEERANHVYPFYDLVLSELGFSNALRGILKEEDMHLKEILFYLEREPVFTPALLTRMRNLEATAFDRMLRAMWEKVLEPIPALA